MPPVGVMMPGVSSNDGGAASPGRSSPVESAPETPDRFGPMPSYEGPRGSAPSAVPSGPAGGGNANRPLPLMRGLSLKTTVMNMPLVFTRADRTAISVSEADGLTEPIAITLVPSHGRVSLAPSRGVQVWGGQPGDAGEVTLVGSARDINNAFEGLSFHPPAGFTGRASLCIDVRYADHPDPSSFCGEPADSAKLQADDHPRAAVTLRIVVAPPTRLQLLPAGKRPSAPPPPGAAPPKTPKDVPPGR